MAWTWSIGGIVLIWLSIAAEKLWPVWPFLFVYTSAKLPAVLQLPAEESAEARAERMTVSRWLVFLSGMSLLMLLLFAVTMITEYLQ